MEWNTRSHNKAAIVYEIREKEGERFYIGATTTKLRLRVMEHFRTSNRHSPFAGLDKTEWEWTVIEECEDKSAAHKKEAELLRIQVGNKNCLNKNFYVKTWFGPNVRVLSSTARGR